MLSGAQRDRIARQIAEIAAAAGDVLNCFRSDQCRREMKADGSPVSEADLAAEAELKRLLSAAFPDLPIISEENTASHDLAPGAGFLLVDPLDGTRSFLDGGKDFCILVALIENAVPVAGAIHAPAEGASWWAGASAWRSEDRAFAGVETLKPAPLRPGLRRAVVSRHHAEGASLDFCARLGIGSVRHENSALKFVRLAQDEADLYPRLGRTMQWDIAAGDALLRALGGGIYDLAGNALRYGPGSAGWANPDFVAFRCVQDRPADSLMAPAGA